MGFGYVDRTADDTYDWTGRLAAVYRFSFDSYVAASEVTRANMMFEWCRHFAELHWKDAVYSAQIKTWPQITYVEGQLKAASAWYLKEKDRITLEIAALQVEIADLQRRLAALKPGSSVYETNKANLEAGIRQRQESIVALQQGLAKYTVEYAKQSAELVAALSKVADNARQSAAYDDALDNLWEPFILKLKQEVIDQADRVDKAMAIGDACALMFLALEGPDMVKNIAHAIVAGIGAIYHEGAPGNSAIFG